MSDTNKRTMISGLRFDTDIAGRIDAAAEKLRLTKTDVVRLAVTHGLPLVEAGQLSVGRKS